MITPLFCSRMIGITLLAGEDAALEVDRHAAVERLLGDLVELGVAARQRYADIVVQDVDAAPAAHALSATMRLDVGFLGDVGLEGDRGALLGPIMSTVSCADASR